jgi:hypothetical protein
MAALRSLTGVCIVAIFASSMLLSESAHARRATLKLTRWMFGGWGYRSRWFNPTRPIGQRKQTAAMNAKNVERHA